MRIDSVDIWHTGSILVGYTNVWEDIRKVIPACVVRRIREAFPKVTDEVYEGFHFADDYDPNIHQ